MKYLMPLTAVSVALLSQAAAFGAPTLTTLYTFTGGADGGSPGAALVPGPKGSFFGTATTGGANNGGTAFQLIPPAGGGNQYTLTPIYSFAGGADGAGPTNLIADEAGNLYGVSNNGGGGTAAACSSNGTPVGCGVVFELQPPPAGQTAWHETILHAFTGLDDGYAPSGLTIFNGKLYGFTWGGSGSCGGGCGTVYELNPPSAGKTDWVYKRLHHFTGVAAADGPFGNPLIDSSGAIYGLAYSGGATAPGGCAPFSGCGEVFKLTPPISGVGNWQKSTLWNFDGLDGTGAFNSLSEDSSGNLYGMTNEGGTSSALCPAVAGGEPAGCGVAFRLVPPGNGNGQWTEQILWNFSGGADGGFPADSALTIEKNGSVLATTSGVSKGIGQYGAVVQLVPPGAGETAWKERTLFTFANDVNGAYPVGAAIIRDGAYYGTTYQGTVYRITP